jgi:3-phosphoshikimate 1-carboxyvinyltransferase
MPMKSSDVRDVAVPGDKSISHRALMLGALATGQSRIRGILDSADVQSSASVLRALGAAVPNLTDDFTVAGLGVQGLRAPERMLDCGNSGTTARLMMGIAAGYAFTARFDGDASLRARPMRRVTDPLTRMGARVRELGDADRLPLEITGGRLCGIDLVNEKSSAQVKSAVLLAALTGGVRATVREHVHSRDHTERMLDAMGAPIQTVVDGGAMCIEIAPVDALQPLDLIVPGDFSSAAFLLARALLTAPAVRVNNVGVNGTRTGLLDVLRRMQATVHVQERRVTGGEPIATLVAESCALHGTVVEPAEIPHLVDEVPILAVLAARARGETVVRGAGELRVKETDRLRAIAANLRAVGANAEETEDGLMIEGSDRPLRGRVTTHGDHRIAMAFGVLGSLPGNEIVIDDVACVAVSFPSFWHQLRELAR